MSDYPQLVRESLQGSRAAGHLFHPAWEAAMVEHPPEDHGWGTWPPDTRNGHECADLLAWLHDHMQAAYNRSESKRGRFRAPQTDAYDLTPREKVTVPSPNPDGLCLSGDGCKEAATHGRFGLRFCERHGLELARLDLPIAKGKEGKGYTSREVPVTA